MLHRTVLFLWIGTTFAFFQRLGKVFISLQLLNMIERGFTILSSHGFNTLMGTSLCSWTLMSSVLIILYISSSSILKDDSLVSVIYAWFSSNLLSFGKRWRQKTFVKKIGFFFKVCNNFSIHWKGRNYWNFSTIVTWFNYRPIHFGTGLWVIQFHW